LCTAAYAGLYALFRPHLPATIDNLLAQLITAVANTAANRRLTFGVTGPGRLVRDHAAGLVAFALALALSTLTLLALNSAGETSHDVELALLMAANLLATLLRFVLLRAWIFKPRQQAVLSLRAAA